MTIYFILIGYVIAAPYLIHLLIPKLDKRSPVLLFVSMLGIYLMAALKAPSVGRDIPGYKRVYEQMALLSWSNYDATWMEWGYETLMMISTHIFHATWQQFTMVCYAFVYYSYYCFIKRYSTDYTLSLMIYICFTFLTFDWSAFRTAIALAICLYAYPHAEKEGFAHFVIFCVISVIAAQIHRSAYTFILVYFIVKIPMTVRTMPLYLGAPVGMMVLRGPIYAMLADAHEDAQAGAVKLGGNLIIYLAVVGMAVLFWRFYEVQNERGVGVERHQSEELSRYLYTSALGVRLLYTGVVIQLFATGTVLTRIAQFMQIYMIVLFPSNLDRLEDGLKTGIKVALYAFLTWYFWKFSLTSREALDIAPYLFFWQNRVFNVVY